MTVVGIDPSKLTGFAVVDSATFPPAVRHFTTLAVADTWEGGPSSARLLHRKAVELAILHGDALIAIEMPFGNRTGNLGSYGAQMLLVGGLLALLTDSGYAHVRVTPQEAKLALTGDLYAKKAAVVTAALALPGATLVGAHLKLEREAMADAVAIALAGARRAERDARKRRVGDEVPV